MRRYEVTSKEWEQIKNLFSPERIGKRGRSAKSNRGMLNGMPWIARSGAQWRELSSCYGFVVDYVFEVGSRQRRSYGNDNATFARLSPEMAKGRPFFGTPSKCRVTIRFLGVNTAL
jgi:hypothetical protein